MSCASNNDHPRLGRAGVTSLELALVLVAFMVLLMGVFDLGRYFFTVQSLAMLMADAARYEICQSSELQNISDPNVVPGIGFDAWAHAPGVSVTVPPLLDASRGNITITVLNFGSVPSDSMTQMTVTVTYQFAFITPGLNLINPMLTETATYSF